MMSTCRTTARGALAAVLACSLLSLAARAAESFSLQEGDRVVFLGDTFVEREQQHGWIELMLTTRFAEHGVTFRNLGWSADTPAGESRVGLSLLQAGREPDTEGWQLLVRQLREAKPTVVFIGYGMASSFEGELGLKRFHREYIRLLDTLREITPSVRLVLLSPIAHEALGAPWPNPTPHNAQLARYVETIRGIAHARKLPFVSLYDRMQARASASPAPSEALTANGIHLTSRGYRRVAEWIEDELLGASPSGVPTWRTSVHTEPLREAIVRKNEWFFHRSRPANMAYIFGFRKLEQGRNATEVLQFETLIAEEEKRIARLRALASADNSAPRPRPPTSENKAASMPHPAFETADGIEITLWAENPLLHKPIQMNFDTRGRLWVVSSESYPHIEPGRAASDKIFVLEDTQGSGRADRATVFADGLLIPTGIELTGDGCYVAQSSELLRFRDTDGDGRADVREVVLSGFGTEDTHHNLHTLRWGPDGRLYMNQSVYTRSQTETPHGVVRLKAGGIFRFNPNDHRLEIQYRGWVNTWGHQFDAYGQSFMTDGAGLQGITWGIVGATYKTHGPARRMVQSITPGAYPKFCAIEIVRSTHFPNDWQGDVITADYRAHRIVRFKLDDQNSGFVGKEMPDLLRTTSDSFRPVDIKLGPDGALYIADWSNPIIQHGEVDFRDPRRDKVHGRIWRVSVKGRPLLPKRDFAKLENGALLDALLSPNSYEQDRARRVLRERGAGNVMPDLRAWEQRQSGEYAKLQALWLHESLGSIRPAYIKTLTQADDARVRAAAVRVLPAAGSLPQLERLLEDKHPRVRLEAARALGRTGSLRGAELALALLEQTLDPFLDYAVWLTINDLAEPWLDAVKRGEWKIAGRERQLEFALRAIRPELAREVLAQLLERQPLPRDGSGPWLDLIAAAGGEAELRALFDHVLDGYFAPAAQARALGALRDAARLRNLRPSGDLAMLGKIIAAPEPAVRLAAIGLAGQWKMEGLVPNLVELATTPPATATQRTGAFEALRNIGGPEAIAALRKLARDGQQPIHRREALVALASLELPTVVPEIVALLKQELNEAEAESLWRALLPIRGLSARLAVELPNAGIPRATAKAGLRPAREGAQHKELAATLARLAGVTLGAATLSPDAIQALVRDAEAHGDPARGEYIYRAAELACVACHAIGGVGGKIGPDLTSIGASAPTDYLVESLIAPNAKIKEGYHAVLLRTTDGRETSGTIVRETPAEIVLRDAANQEISIAVQSIEKRTSGGSLMPAGLIDGLSREDALDLIKFLSVLGKPGLYDAARGGVARAWQLYQVVSDNQHLGVERVVRGDFTLESWRPAPSLVSGVLPKRVVDELAPQRLNTRGLFVATKFTTAKAGKVSFKLSGASGIERGWVNGHRVNIGPSFAADVPAGMGVVVLQVSETATPATIKLTSADVTFAP